MDFIAGCLGGCAGVVVGHPLDTIKVHLQTQDSKNPKYRGTWHCFNTIWKEERIRGLYRGMLSPIAGVGLVNAVVFGVYGNVQRRMPEPDVLTTHFVAGCTAGLVQSLVCSPIELSKTRMQLQTTGYQGVKYKGSLDCLMQVMKTEGVRGTFKGLGITALRDVPAFAAYFVSYEYMMHLPENPTALHCFLAGGFAGQFSWICCYPFDVIKTCLQSEPTTGTAKYNSIMDVVRKGYISDGYRFFFRGLNSTLIRAFPSNAACFLVVSLVLSLTQNKSIDLVAKPLSLLESGRQTLANLHPHFHYDDDAYERKRIIIARNMKAFNAFNEAVGPHEIEELSHELYARRIINEDSNYYT